MWFLKLPRDWFTTDSLWLRLNFHSVHTWNANKTSIHTEIPNNSDILNPNFYYSLSRNNDTLHLSSIKDTTQTKYKFIKITDRYKYYNLSIGLNIDLPTKDTILLPINNNYRFPHLFVNSNNGKLIIKKNNIHFMQYEYLRHYVFQIRHYLLYK